MGFPYFNQNEKKKPSTEHSLNREKWMNTHVGVLDLYQNDYLTSINWVRFTWPSDPSAYDFPARCYWTPLHIAAAWGNDELVNLLLNNGADINALSRMFCECMILPNYHNAPLWTPLHIAMCRGHESTTRLLLSRGASIHLTTRYKGSDSARFTALHGACDVGLFDAARAILEEGYQADPAVPDRNNMTPLAYAFVRGNWAIIDLLMEHGADINVQISDFNLLDHACIQGYYAEALRLLDLGVVPQPHSIETGVDPIWFHIISVVGTVDFPSHPRSSSQIGYRLPLVKRLIEQGIDVNARSADGSTALMEAASLHRADMVEVLLNSGADVHLVLNPLCPISALQRAVGTSCEEALRTPKGAMLRTVRLLLQAMEGNSCPPGDTPKDIDIARAFGALCAPPRKHEDQLEVADLLLTYKKTIKLVLEDRPDLLMLVIRQTHFDTSDLLLDSGFRPPNDEMLEALMKGFIDDDESDGLCYLARRFPITTSRIHSSELLFDAVKANSWICVEFLITKKGECINSRDEEGNSLLYVACKNDNLDVAEVLLKHGADPDECTQCGKPLTIVATDDNNDLLLRLL
ncbi:hypothetical protein NPX13_g4340 [Xylaria arbuscula]|uniref:Ankyrin n=1 Tax=Xylaria arbuscula TaxID=114810 RepID=A0A9W8NGJ6_9PEZI|nr:hypothetical protein NPX13_g4340 [Xylaria arbuscula]